MSSHKVKHLIYASSISVYGANVKMPFSTEDEVSHPLSLYATTKKSNELMTHTYSHLYEIPTTDLRFCTVYSPMVRPDMAYLSFKKKIVDGEMTCNFTYIVDEIVSLLDQLPKVNPDFDSEDPNLG